MKTYISRKQAAEKLGVTSSSISNYIKRGYFSCNIIGKSIQIDENSFNEFVEKTHNKIKQIEQLNNELDAQLQSARLELESIIQFNKSIKALDVIARLRDIFESILESGYEREKTMALDYLSGKPIQQIAEEHCLTLERVRQIIARAARRGSARFRVKLKQLNDAHSELNSLRRRVAELEYLVHNPAEKQSSIIPDILLTNVRDLDLSIRALNCLETADIYTIGQLIQYTKSDLLKFRNFGRKSIKEIEEFLNYHNLSFKNNQPNILLI